MIIGAGCGGIGLGIRLRAAGLTDFVILEKSGSVGGVWRANSYPGAACDVPPHLYSFSFAPKADWPEKYARQRDILDYLVDCTRRHGLEPHIRLDSDVTDARFDAAAARWIVRTRDAVFEAQALVSATGHSAGRSARICPASRALPGRRAIRPNGGTTMT